MHLLKAVLCLSRAKADHFFPSARQLIEGACKVYGGILLTVPLYSNSETPPVFAYTSGPFTTIPAVEEAAAAYA